MKNYLFALMILFMLISCSFPGKKPNVQEALTGNWLILYPDHQTNGREQSRLYAKAQDSIVSLRGLKMLSFNKDGTFQLIDSLYKKSGKWTVKQNELNVVGGGKGWDDFNGRLIGFRNDTLQVVEYIPLGNESIRVIWFLKKVNEAHEAFDLFSMENNWWREKPKRSESKPALQQKVKSILEYYSTYFETVSKEAIYFTGSRVQLPFRYYQHGAGLMPFNEYDAFSRIFFDRDDARKAYKILEDVFFKAKKRGFPSGENYVIEYSAFLQWLANYL